MKPNLVRHKLRRGEPSIGTWLSVATPMTAALMARAGFDWLTVELEHSPTSFETAAACFAIIAANGLPPFARLPINSTENIKRVLDTGAWGVIVPMVNTRAEAEAVVAAARFPPVGRRSVGGQLHAANFATDAATYYRRANDEIFVAIMAETPQAIENLDDMLAVPGIDAVFIGPNDLHNSLGLPPAFESDHPAFVGALQHVLVMCRKHNVAPGLHVADAAMAQRRLAEGFRFIAVASEAGFMLGKAAEVTKALGLGQGGATAKY